LRAGAAVLAAFWAAAAAPAAAREASWHSIEVWRQPQGLPQNSVLGIIQTRDGYIWVATRAGVSRFDGVRFKTFDDRTKTELLDGEVQALVEGDDGSVWVGTYGGGLTRIHERRFTTYTTKDGLPHDFIWTLDKDTEGGIWIGTSSGLSRFYRGSFTNYTTRDGLAHNTINAVRGNPDGTVWVGTSAGSLHLVRNGKVEPSGLAPFPESIRMITRAPDGTVWVATNGGLFRWKDGLTHYTTKDGLFSNRVPRVHLDHDGSLWIGTLGGICIFKDGVIRQVDVGEDLSATNVTGLLRDREGNLWAGYFDRGLARIRRGDFASYMKADGLPSHAITTLYADRSGTMWAGTSLGLAVLRDDRWVPVSESYGLDGSNVTAIEEDTDGRLWVGTEKTVKRTRESLRCAKPPCLSPFVDVPTSVQRPLPRAIVRDREGTIWVGTNTDGLLRYRDGAFTRFTSKDGLAHDDVKAIAEGPDGTLWVGTKYGLCAYRDGRFRAYGREDGLVSDALEGLYVDAENTLWAATRQGLVRFKDGVFTTITTAHGLFSTLIHNMVGDDHGNLWITSPKGVFRVRKQELEDFAAGKTTTVKSIVYGVEQGLPSTVVPGGHVGALRDPNGRIWLGTARGVAVVDPAHLEINDAPPTVQIEEVSINGRVIDSAHAGAIRPGRGDISIRYTGLTFLAAHDVTFQYRLLGYDPQWVNAGTRRETSYTNIPSGHYTFQVKAANSNGVWNETGGSFSFVLEPHFYETPWFYLLCACAVVVAGVGLHNVRTRQLRARERHLERSVQERTHDLELAQAGLEKRVRERTAELAEVNETLRVSLTEKEVLLKEIHHRVRNNLQIVSSLLNLQSEHVADVPTLSALRESQDRVRAMAQIHEKLYQSEGLSRIDVADYIRSMASSLFTSYGVRGDLITLKLEVDDVKLGLDTAIPCGLIINELISNALKHAFPNGRAGEVRVELRSSGDGRLLLRVSDDGIGVPDGFDPRRSRSLGLQLVQALTDQLDGTVEIRRDGGSVFEVRFQEIKYKERIRPQGAPPPAAERG
jgi:two-component sensor histidine kinase/ligand-binding sensor domain-containing protein